MSKLLFFELSEKVLDAAFTIHKAVGPGFLEHAYEEAICIELKANKIPFNRQKVFTLEYKGNVIGSYVADIVISGKIILELKSCTTITKNMEAQLLNYLHVSGVQVGYVINFRNRLLEWKRFVMQPGPP